MINTRVKVYGQTLSGTKGLFAGNLDKMIVTPKGTIAIVNRMPIYFVTKIEDSPSEFERKWK